MDPSTFLYDVPPVLIERLCRILDSGDERLGWRGLAVRVLPSLLEVRMLERVEASGRSPSWELLWSWSQENPRVQDLVSVLQDLNHQRALRVLQEPLSPNDQTKSGQSETRSEGHMTCPGSGSTGSGPLTFRVVCEGTRDFHPDLRVSEGQMCDLYQASVGQRTLAVKLFTQTSSASWRELWDVFTQETEIHKRYPHPNILAPLSVLSDGVRFVAVSPFVSSGSLHRRLHRQGAEPLTWRQRLSIINGAAKALHHLHTAPPRPVVHGNVSSSNILLDGDLQPKLSDLGVARLRPISTNQSCTVTMSSRQQSILGYQSEEFMRHGKLTTSLDVYSLGMVIMETVTGRKVIEETPKPLQLRELLLSEVESSGGFDSCLSLVDVSAGGWPKDIALGLLKLSLECTNSRHRSRPDTSNVLVALSKLLPPPCCPPSDEPRTLEDGYPLRDPHRDLRDPHRDPLRDPHRDLFRDPLIDPHRDQRDTHRDPHRDLFRDPLRDPHRDTHRDPLRDPYRDQIRDHLRDPHRDQIRDQSDPHKNPFMDPLMGAPSSSIPVEHDEQRGPPGPPEEPRECSQSEVTYLSEAVEEEEEEEEQQEEVKEEEVQQEEVDLYSSFPVQCSCPAAGLMCDDCTANGFTDGECVVENEAKKRLRDKLSLYNEGLIHTEELLSEDALPAAPPN